MGLSIDFVGSLVDEGLERWRGGALSSWLLLDNHLAIVVLVSAAATTTTTASAVATTVVETGEVGTVGCWVVVAIVSALDGVVGFHRGN